MECLFGKNQIFGPVLSDRHNSSDRRVPLFRFVKAKKMEKSGVGSSFWRASEKNLLKKLIEYFLVQWSEYRFMNALWLMDAFHDISSQCSLQEPH